MKNVLARFIAPLVFAAVLFSVGIDAPTAQADFGPVGQVVLSADTNAMSMNLGGPSLKITPAEDWILGVSFFPSLRMSWEGKLTPALGAGPFVDWKHIILAAPCYYVSNTWYVSGGIGYRF